MLPGVGGTSTDLLSLIFHRRWDYQETAYLHQH
jgi:hypothetical protein